MSERPIPQPRYCCARPDCCADNTWTADELWWSERKQGFYCDNCWDYDTELEDEDKGDSLADELASRGVSHGAYTKEDAEREMLEALREHPWTADD